MIVKHETRIRTLETKNKEQEKQLMSQVLSQFVPLQCVLNFDDIFELRTRRGLYYFQKLSFSTKTDF